MGCVYSRGASLLSSAGKVFRLYDSAGVGVSTAMVGTEPTRSELSMRLVVTYPGPADGRFRTVVVGVNQHQRGQDATPVATELLAHAGSLTRAYAHVSDSLIGHGSSPDMEPDSSLSGHRPRAAAGDDDPGVDELPRAAASFVGRGLPELVRVEVSHVSVTPYINVPVSGR